MSNRDSFPTSVQAAATSPEDTLRELDQSNARAVLKADAETLERHYAPDHLLHFAPKGVVRTRQQVLDDVREKRLLYTSFSRVTEHASLHGDLGVTIGSEVVVPKGKHPVHPEGEHVERRYTHIWRRDGSCWQLLVRHVNLADRK